MPTYEGNQMSTPNDAPYKVKQRKHQIVRRSRFNGNLYPCGPKLSRIYLVRHTGWL